MPRTRWPVHRVETAAHIVICAAHLASILNGALVVLVPPSPSLAEVLSGPWAYGWSAGIVAFGLVSIVGRLRRDWEAEAIGLITSGGALALWSILVVVQTLTTGTGGALQIGSRLAVGCLYLVGFGLIEIAFVKNDRRTRDGVIAAVNQELRRRADE